MQQVSTGALRGDRLTGMWFKVDDALHDHGKVRGADPAAIGLWTLAGSWCGQHKTNGFVPSSVVPRWTPKWKRLASELVDRNLWTPAKEGREDGWRFVNWDEYQPSREETDVPLERLRWRRKQALKKNRDLCEQIVARDRGLCRYCAERVNFNDRKSGKGGTYDHVDPDGDNSLDNVVVACRKCNGRKRDRTPHEAGMPLLPVPVPYASGSGSSSTRNEPDESGSIRADSLEAVRDQVGSGRSQVGTRIGELDLPSANGHSTNGVHALSGAGVVVDSELRRVNGSPT